MNGFKLWACFTNEVTKFKKNCFFKFSNFFFYLNSFINKFEQQKYKNKLVILKIIATPGSNKNNSPLKELPFLPRASTLNSISHA
jgi:hypothetical protein